MDEIADQCAALLYFTDVDDLLYTSSSEFKFTRLCYFGSLGGYRFIMISGEPVQMNEI